RRSGWGVLSPEPRFDNSYFKSLLQRFVTERLQNSPEGRCPISHVIMGESDLALVRDASFREHVEAYAGDQGAFFQRISPIAGCDCKSLGGRFCGTLSKGEPPPPPPDPPPPSPRPSSQLQAWSGCRRSFQPRFHHCALCSSQRNGCALAARARQKGPSPSLRPAPPSGPCAPRPRLRARCVRAS
ncbi:unnamed protein product, partial [Prorocentrum cordatum]